MIKSRLNLRIVAAIAACLVVTMFASCKKDTPDLNGTVTITPNVEVVPETELTATYSGSETVTWQWKKGGEAIDGATKAKYTPTVAGMYSATASAKGYKDVTSAAVDVQVRDLKGAITISPNADVYTGDELTAAYGGSETATITWQWYKGSAAISGATKAKYKPTEAGSYTVTASAKGYNSKPSAAVDVKDIPAKSIIVTGLEDYNGKYGYVTINNDDKKLFAGSNWNNSVLITSGTIFAEIWLVADEDIFDPTERWTGHGDYYIEIHIIDTPDWCNYSEWIWYSSENPITIKQKEITTIKLSDYSWFRGSHTR